VQYKSPNFLPLNSIKIILTNQLRKKYTNPWTGKESDWSIDFVLTAPFQKYGKVFRARALTLARSSGYKSSKSMSRMAFSGIISDYAGRPRQARLRLEY